MVEIFKTDIRELQVAHKVILQLREHFPEAKINFDLEDCDRILRVESTSVETQKIINLLHQSGHQSELIP